MSDYIYLSGSEDVKNAAHVIRRASEDMMRAANQFDCTVDRLIRALEDFTSRIEVNFEATK